MRPLLAIVACVLAAALGALILGEYELVGATALVAGLLFGLLVGEVGIVTAGRSSVARAASRLPVVAPLTTGAGLVWAGWISSGRDWSFVSTEAWAGVAVGVLAAAAWVRSPRRRAPRTRPTL
ncbi:MAG: hypothetical protein ACRD1K_09965 [Acidimicrobiales bacterium]